MSNKTRVLIVDDSAVIRGLLARAVEAESTLELVGTAMHGQAALSQLAAKPIDVIVMDVEMPVMDGITALGRICHEYPSVAVIMASSLTSEGAETTVKALALGAAGCIAKPKAANISMAIEQLSRELIPQIKALGKRGQASAGVTARPAGIATAVPQRPRTPGRCAPEVLVIGTSTGGPKALSLVLSGLSQDFPLPILIVQHMPPLFTPMLAKHLQQDCGRPCAEARDGEPILAGHTYVAPGDYHLEIRKVEGRRITHVYQGEAEHFCRPSVNPLFRSAAKTYGSGVLATMLTGMGEDGIEGTHEVARAGGYVIAQDEASCVVWGMPAAVVRDGLANEILPLGQIAASIEKHCLLGVGR